MNTNTNDFEKLSEPFKALIGNQGLNHQILDLLPIPIEIFAPDGMLIFSNRAWLEFNNIPDASLVVGKYNLKDDPVVLKIMGQDNIDIFLRGESGSFSDFPAPIQDLVDRGVLAENEKPWQAATMDIFCLPLWDGDKFVCSIMFFTVKNMYHGRTDIAKAQEYMEIHWRDEFDIEKIAQAASLSKRHFQRIFKDVTGCTPIEFHQKLKIEKIKEKLLDGNLGIAQAFTACGVDYHGAYFKLFKEKVEMTPSEYRKANMKS